MITKYIIRTIRTEHLYYSKQENGDIGFSRREDKAILFDSEEIALDCITIFYFNNRVVKEMIEIVKVYI